jgi:methylmalonyl-CoA/ethylmalonyl-CoA epimerase
MFQRIDHVGIAVAELDPALALYAEQFGVELVHRELLCNGGVDAALLNCGESQLELIAPLEGGTALTRFLAKRGPGMHHIAYEVDDIEATLAALRARAVSLIDKVPRPGIRDSLVAFIHPSSCAGVLTEIVQVAS